MGKRLQRPFSVTTGFKPVVTEKGAVFVNKNNNNIIAGRLKMDYL